MTKIHPTFIHIGASRTASTWLHKTLNTHPEVFIPNGKDTLFFLNTEKYSLSWYLSFFDSARAQKARGEICHRYFSSEIAAQKIYQQFPNIKIICCLREPFERMASYYHYSQQIGLYPHDDFATFISRPEIKREFDYLENLKRFYNLFPRNQIHIMFYEDLKSDYAQFLHNLLYFLEVDTNFLLPKNSKVWVNREARLPLLTHFAYKSSQLLRAQGHFNLTGKLKSFKLLDRILFKENPLVYEKKSPPIASKMIRTSILRSYSQIEELIQIKLPNSWHTASIADNSL